MAIDLLAFGPHPDDAEIGCGGMLLKMKSLGYTTGIIDMTRGDMGWGTPEERDRECAEAATILKLDVRETLDMGDCRVEDTFENRCKVAQVIRKHRPQVIFAPYYDLPIGRGLGHNDHFKTGILVSQGYNFSHLRKMPIEGEPWQAKAIFYYFLPAGTPPTFLVDVSDQYEDWRRALEAHKSQFSNPEKPRPASGPASILDWFDVYARRDAGAIGARYAQSYLSTSALKVNDPMMLVRDIVPRP
ncbi:MAG: PIG-L family deacetylase [Candidatus Eisenbacteria bacterium]